MSFNKSAFSPAALKKGNASGVKLTFKHKADGHTFNGEVSSSGTGKMSHSGVKWMGFDMTNSMTESGKHSMSFKRSQNLGGQAFKLSLGVDRQVDAWASGDFTLGANTTFTK